MAIGRAEGCSNGCVAEFDALLSEQARRGEIKTENALVVMRVMIPLSEKLLADEGRWGIIWW